MWSTSAMMFLTPAIKMQVTPVQKVLQALEEMKAKGEVDMDSEQKNLSRVHVLG